MKLSDIEPEVAHIVVEIIEYIPNSVLIKSILNQTTGHVRIMSFDAGEGLLEKISPFDTFAQVIDGEAEVIIEGKIHRLSKGQGMIIPAHRSHLVNAKERFKIIMTVIKSGYEQ